METIYIYNECIDEKILNINNDTNILIFNNCLKRLNINVLDNVKVEINEFNNNQKDDTIINLNIKNNSEILYNLSNLINDKYNIKINIIYEGSNSKVQTNIHSIVEGSASIKINGVVKNECKNNELLESVQVLLKNNGKCEVEPDMLISTKEIIANHLVGISPVRKEELNYLMSKCLSRQSAENLIYKSFILSNIKQEELREKIKENLL